MVGGFPSFPGFVSQFEVEQYLNSLIPRTGKWLFAISILCVVVQEDWKNRYVSIENNYFDQAVLCTVHSVIHSAESGCQK